MYEEGIEGAMYSLIQALLQKYDKVFLVTCLFPQKEWDCFSSIFTMYKSRDLKVTFLLEEGINSPSHFDGLVISHSEAEYLYKLYLTYEFSDRFIVFADSTQYGTLFHYIETGILTEEEAIGAMLA